MKIGVFSGTKPGVKIQKTVEKDAADITKITSDQLLRDAIKKDELFEKTDRVKKLNTENNVSGENRIRGKEKLNQKKTSECIERAAITAGGALCAGIGAIATAVGGPAGIAVATGINIVTASVTSAIFMKKAYPNFDIAQEVVASGILAAGLTIGGGLAVTQLDMVPLVYTTAAAAMAGGILPNAIINNNMPD